MKEPEKNKMMEKPPERGKMEYFMFPAGPRYPVPVTVQAKTQEEANIEYQKIIKNKKTL